MSDEVARKTVKRILQDHGIDPAPERSQRTPWRTFLLAHFGEGHLRLLTREYVEHYHRERNHQGLDNRLLQQAPRRRARPPTCRPPGRPPQFLPSRRRVTGRPIKRTLRRPYPSVINQVCVGSNRNRRIGGFSSRDSAPRAGLDPATLRLTGWCRFTILLILRACSSGGILLLPGVREEIVH